MSSETALPSTQPPEPVSSSSYLRGVRIDASYFYSMFASGTSLNDINAHVIAQAKASGVNTLFVYAYNSTYGGYYPTSYSLTKVENGYGQLNIFKSLTQAAKKNNLKVVAVVPVNNFKEVWLNKPAWRAKNKNGTDYIPAPDIHLLSAWHPDFRAWLNGFYSDLLTKNPDIDGLEAVEPFVDYNWNKASDYNPEANSVYSSLYPSGVLGDANWLKLRAQGLTELIAIMNSLAHSHGKESYLVQTWPAKPNGELFSSDVIRDNIGLDLDTLLNLAGESKLNYFMAEIMWQQWAAEYGGSAFTPAWTRTAALEVIQFVNSRCTALLHVEVSPFDGAVKSIAPTLQEFKETLLALRDLNAGIDVYDQHQLSQMNAWESLLSWN